MPNRFLSRKTTHSAPAEVADRAKDLSAKLVESIVSADDALMERYLGDEKISPEEISACFAKGLVSGALTPVLCVSAEKDIGVAVCERQTRPRTSA